VRWDIPKTRAVTTHGGMVGRHEKNRKVGAASAAVGVKVENWVDKKNVVSSHEGKVINVMDDGGVGKGKREEEPAIAKRTRDYYNNTNDKCAMENAIKDMEQHFAVHGKKSYSDILTICALKHKIPPSSLYSYTRADSSRRRSTSRGRGRPCIVDNHTLDGLLKRYAPKRYKSKDVKGEILSRQPDLEAVQVKNFLRTFKRKVMEYRTAMGIDIEG
jgi:hypothetical protein